MPIFTAILSCLCLQPGHRETYLGNVTMIRQQQLELDLPDLMKVDMKVWRGETPPNEKNEEGGRAVDMGKVMYTQFL